MTEARGRMLGTEAQDPAEKRRRKKQAYGVAKNQNRPNQQGSTIGKEHMYCDGERVKEDSMGNKRKRPTHLQVPGPPQQKKGGEDERAQPQASGEDKAQSELPGHEGRGELQGM